MAQLRSIRLRGFKTFARPTELIFEKGVTVIIGPNGSGKSNIADAVLWVLGEQSPTSLRGRNMQDVIFAGTNGRRSSVAAEVSLVFDNRSGLLPIEAQEVEVTRRLEREGTSEYRLNGSTCRLLDIQDLVGALGLGREMHSVVGQGKVEAFLSSSPEARRAMIEEACGLGRLKKRRERAQAKLEKTRQNLLRLADVEREVKAALRPLRQQAAAAQRYAEAKEEWASAKAKVLLHGLLTVKSVYQQTESRLEAIERRRAELEARLAELARQRAAAEQEFSLVSAWRDRVVEAAHRARLQADQLESRAGSLAQRMARLEAEKDRALRRRELAQAEAAELELQRVRAEAEANDETRLERVARWHSLLREALDERQPAYRSALAAEEDLRDLVFDLEATRSRLAQDREFLRRELEGRLRLESELEALVEEAERKLAFLEGEQVRSAESLKKAELALTEARNALRAVTADLAEARAAEAACSRQGAALAEEQAGLEARRRVVAELISRREGIPVAARRLLDEGDCLLVVEALRAQPGYEKAMVAALGPLAQAVLLRDRGGVVRVWQGEGPVEAVLAEGEDPPAGRGADFPEGTRDLWELVNGPLWAVNAVRGLLPPVAVVVGRDHLGPEDIEASAAGWCLVSRQGEVVIRGSHLARREESASEGLLRWRRELEEIETALGRLADAREAAATELSLATAARKEIETRLRSAEQAVREAERAVGTALNECDLLARRIEEAGVQRREAWERREKEAALKAKISQELAAAEEAWAGQESQLETARADLRAQQARTEELRMVVGRLEAKRNQANLLEVKLRERCRAQQAERSRINEQCESVRAEVEKWNRRAELCGRILPLFGELCAVAGQLAARAREEATRLGQELMEAQRRLQERAAATHDWGGVEAGLRQEAEELAGQVAELRVEAARLEDRRAALESELTELRRRHHSPRSLGPEEVAGEDEVALNAAVERAERRLERIGPVNPLAETECRELEERAAFLAEQRRDLETSLTELRGVIAELDAHIEEDFGAMFNLVRDHFAGVIAAVFPGARGSLTLVDCKPESGRDLQGQEPLGAEEADHPGAVSGQGIALEVKLPNKSPRSLSLLSGGEKAMTAIAFLFSLFLARPCPFYILDEVDASLDDINLRRFLSLVRRHKEQTQFIIITHQRQTMEVADTLYGVTMERDGSSRVLSRRLAAAKGA